MKTLLYEPKILSAHTVQNEIYAKIADEKNLRYMLHQNVPMICSIRLNTGIQQQFLCRTIVINRTESIWNLY